MKHVASFSTGLPSAFVVERLRERHGDENVIVVFMDVMNEHHDNYRFKQELKQKRWANLQFIDLCEGRNPWQVSEDENMIFNQRRHPCTRILKIEPFMRCWQRCQKNQQYTSVLILQRLNDARPSNEIITRQVMRLIFRCYGDRWKCGRMQRSPEASGVLNRRICTAWDLAMPTAVNADVLLGVLAIGFDFTSISRARF